jgi:hypothetical protein
MPPAEMAVYEIFGTNVIEQVVDELWTIEDPCVRKLINIIWSSGIIPKMKNLWGIHLDLPLQEMGTPSRFTVFAF